MSNPTVAQVDTISGDSGNAPSFQYGDAEPGLIHRTYKRTFEHYVQNNMTATGYTETIINNDVTSWSLDEGWHLIPYWNPAVAMTASDIAQFAVIGDGIRIDSLGFKIKNAQLFRTDITAITGVTELSNTFVQEPYWEYYCDGQHTFEGMVRPIATSDTSFKTPGYPVMYSNNTMRNMEAVSFVDGELPRVKWNWNNGNTPTGLVHDYSFQRRGTQDSPFGVLSTLNDDSRQCTGTPGVASLSHEWVNKDKGAFYPFMAPQSDHSMWPQRFGTHSNYPGTFPTRRDYILNGTAGQNDDGAANARGTNLTNSKHNRWAKVDWDTMTPQGMNDLPPDCFIKIQRLHDVTSPIRLAGRILIEYTCSVTISPSNKYNPGLAFTAAGASTTTLDHRTVQNRWTQNPLRHWRMWGIPSLPAATAGSLVTGTVRFPAWVPFNDWNGGNGGRPPVSGFLSDWPDTDNPNGLFFKPHLELAQIRDVGSNPATSGDTLFCLTESWDGDPPTTTGETIDAFSRNGVHLPALTAYGTVSGIPPMVWVMESVVQTRFNNGASALDIFDNPLLSWLGPGAPAENLHHLFADTPAEAMDVSACSLARKRRREEQLREEEVGSD